MAKWIRHNEKPPFDYELSAKWLASHSRAVWVKFSHWGNYGRNPRYIVQITDRDGKMQFSRKNYTLNYAKKIGQLYGMKD